MADETPAEVSTYAKEEMARAKLEAGIGFAPFVLVVVAAIFLALALSFLHQAEEAEGWPSTTGKIIESKVESSKVSGSRATPSSAGNPNVGGTGVGTSGGVVYGAAVRYEYQVEGVPFQGSRVHLVDVHSSDRALAEAEVALYAAGRSVDVFYDPDDPGTAVLERTGARLLAGLCFLAAAGLFAMAVLFVGMALRNKRNSFVAAKRAAGNMAVTAALKHVGQDHRWYRRSRGALIEDADKAALVARALRQWAPEDLDEAKGYFEATVAPEHRGLFESAAGEGR